MGNFRSVNTESVTSHDLLYSALKMATPKSRAGTLYNRVAATKSRIGDFYGNKSVDKAGYKTRNKRPIARCVICLSLYLIANYFLHILENYWCCRLSLADAGILYVVSSLLVPFCLLCQHSTSIQWKSVLCCIQKMWCSTI